MHVPDSLYNVAAAEPNIVDKVDKVVLDIDDARSPEGSPEGTEPTEEWEEVRIEEPGASEPAA